MLVNVIAAWLLISYYSSGMRLHIATWWYICTCACAYSVHSSPDKSGLIHNITALRSYIRGGGTEAVKAWHEVGLIDLQENNIIVKLYSTLKISSPTLSAAYEVHSYIATVYVYSYKYQKTQLANSLQQAVEPRAPCYIYFTHIHYEKHIVCLYLNYIYLLSVWYKVNWTACSYMYI